MCMLGYFSFNCPTKLSSHFLLPSLAHSNSAWENLILFKKPSEYRIYQPSYLHAVWAFVGSLYCWEKLFLWPSWPWQWCGMPTSPPTHLNPCVSNPKFCLVLGTFLEPQNLACWQPLDQSYDLFSEGWMRYIGDVFSFTSTSDCCEYRNISLGIVWNL